MRWKWWKNSSYKQSVLEMKNKSSYKIVLLKWAYLDHLQYPLFFNLTSHIKLQLKRIITSYSEHANITLRASISMLIHTRIIFIFKMKLFQINKHYIHRDIIQGQKCNLLNMNNLWLTMSTWDCIQVRSIKWVYWSGNINLDITVLTLQLWNFKCYIFPDL